VIKKTGIYAGKELRNAGESEWLFDAEVLGANGQRTTMQGKVQAAGRNQADAAVAEKILLAGGKPVKVTLVERGNSAETISITAIPEAESDGKWDWRVRITKPSGEVLEDKVSGGRQVAEDRARGMLRDSGRLLQPVRECQARGRRRPEPHDLQGEGPRWFPGRQEGGQASHGRPEVRGGRALRSRLEVANSTRGTPEQLKARVLTNATPCYECGSANSSCSVQTLPCGCRVHQRSVYHDGAYHRAQDKDWTEKCTLHRDPPKKSYNRPCAKCGTYCYGDCEANANSARGTMGQLELRIASLREALKTGKDPDADQVVREELQALLKERGGNANVGEETASPDELADAGKQKYGGNT